MTDFSRVRKTVAALLVAAGAVIFLVSGFRHFAELRHFSDLLLKHDLIPESLAGAAAWGVSGAEIVVGVVAAWCLVTDRGRRIALGALAVAVLMGAMSLYATSLVFWPPPVPVPCGCGIGAALPVEDWTPIAMRNGLLTAVMAAAAFVANLRPRDPIAKPRSA
ncbi:MAG: hypothetical protein DYG93_02135 [Leptolyngbya sp. PLA2]|nr:hypothetical protein [Leptolyngbya sp. PL-A2]MCQ3940986.1 hypothetical protein [cyanobacterium CYA1]MCZ7633141.1 hypothetical protein [Phycisphaerales bacterium]MDL1905580.1 hypothetical protein [Synechococcales cyanobacterium CNB]GIK18381.1 MAG: hypothetical protein BroJett004_05450 [Planctomycetota bacterium]